MTTLKLEELDELCKLEQKVTNPIVKALLKEEIKKQRAYIVDDFLTETKQKYKIVEEVIEKEVEVFENQDEELSKQIKGFNAKSKSLAEMCPDCGFDKIRDALIRCKGNEERALEGLLTGELPKRETPKQVKVKKTIKKTIKKTVPIIEERKKTDREDFEYMVSRIKLLRKKNEEKKIITTKLLEKASDLNQRKEDLSKLYLPGEYEALQKGELRIFNFKQERTISNEVSFIHFRVAESQFFRLVGAQASYSVTKVRYICQPFLVKQFERKRAEIAVNLGITYKENKPILAYAPIPSKKIMEIVDKGFHNGKNGTKFSMKSSDFTHSMKNTPDDILFCLVLLGKSSKNGYQSGCNSSTSQNQWIVYDDDQILPYYIVTFDKPQYQLNQGIAQKLLDDEWKDMEGDAKVDKQMDDTQKYYQEALKKKRIEKSMGVVNEDWFDDYYAQKNQNDEKPLDIYDLETPIEEGDIDYEIEITPSGKSDGDYDFTPSTAGKSDNFFDDVETPKDDEVIVIDDDDNDSTVVIEIDE
eukprot:gene12567-6387_t